MALWKKYLKAARFAKKAHEGQGRAHGAPYFTHPKAVARALWKAGYRGDVIVAAYLHDVVEDTPLPEGYISWTGFLTFNFELEVAKLVLAVTKQEGEPRADYFRRVKAAGPLAVALKRADRDHNNSELRLAPAHYTHLREKAQAKTELMEKIFNE